MNAAAQILEHLDGQLDWQEKVYTDLHRHPEISMEEERTRGRILEELRGLGLEPRELGGGVVVVIENGTGPSVLARADFDALPVAEATGLDYASETEGVMHACGHDMHVTCLLGAVKLLAEHRELWSGTSTAVFQPGEETAQGARSMVEAGLTEAVPRPDVALGQHIMPMPAGTFMVKPGPTMSQGDSVRVTLHGSGAHGSMPQNAVDPVVLASAVVLRLQTVVSRTNAPGDFGVLTVGSVRAGEKSNIIPDRAELLLNLRTYDTAVRERMIEALERIVRGECEASGCPQEPEFEYYDQFPLTDNDAATAERVAEALGDYFGQEALLPGQPVTASEDFSEIPAAFGVPYAYWFVGCMDPETVEKARRNGTQDRDIPANHSPYFAPVLRPTVVDGTEAQVLAALGWLGK